LAEGSAVLTLKNVSKVQDTILFQAKFHNLICRSNLSQPVKEWFWQHLGKGDKQSKSCGNDLRVQDFEVSTY
jgi:hypothetical protein